MMKEEEINQIALFWCSAFMANNYIYIYSTCHVINIIVIQKKKKILQEMKWNGKPVIFWDVA